MTGLRAWLSLLLAALVCVALLAAGASGAGPLPPLGAAFNPATGVWAMADGAQALRSETLTVPGLEQPVEVAFDRAGTAYVRAQTDHDMFLALGYLVAENRLTQMDLMRREGEGLLSQVVGPEALPSDRFELSLGLLRTARTNWLDTPATSPAHAALLAYAAGVNDVIRQDERDGRLPALFKLLDYAPAPWTPVDSLIIQGIMTQDLDYTTAPIEYALLAKSLGPSRTARWLPVDPPNAQRPYDTGPYVRLPLSPMPSQTTVQGSWALTGGVPTGALGTTPSSGRAEAGAPGVKAAAAVLRQVAALGQDFRHTFGDSNNWAVSGAHTASGQAMLAGDPHLAQTLPAIWYQAALTAPGYDVSGVALPGVPAVVIGYNRSIAWSLTDVENQATFFYRETTSPAHPHAYEWDGAWRPMRRVVYSIPVRGEANASLTVRLTVHGPLMTQSGQTLAVDWAGALPSDDLDALLAVDRAQDFTDFLQALSGWHSPSQNFVYADGQGNIGLVSAGYYPEVASGTPWTVLSGTGAEDIRGTVPYTAVPRVFDPRDGLVFSANQRVVTDAYPYYIGTALDFFDPGYRADQIYATLSGARSITPASFARLQTNVQDLLAAQMTPELLAALRGAALTAKEKAAAALLEGWSGDMTAESPQATIWWYFLADYVRDAFGPWWKAAHVPVATDPNLALSTGSEVATPLIEDLQVWTASDPGNAAFSPPGGRHRTARSVMAQAFRQAVGQLARALGPKPATWAWGRVHRREFASVLGVPALAYGPRASSGDPMTVDAADGGLVSGAGPSWRMIVTWSAGGSPVAEGIYPGGQSENPVSPLYEDGVALWWAGRYRPMSLATQEGAGGAAAWRLEP